MLYESIIPNAFFFFRLTRVDILNLACEVGHTDCLAEAQSRFNNWIQTKEALSQDLRSLIYKYGKNLYLYEKDMHIMKLLLYFRWENC